MRVHLQTKGTAAATTALGKHGGNNALLLRDRIGKASGLNSGLQRQSTMAELGGTCGDCLSYQVRTVPFLPPTCDPRPVTCAPTTRIYPK